MDEGIKIQLKNTRVMAFFFFSIKYYHRFFTGRFYRNYQIYFNGFNINIFALHIIQVNVCVHFYHLFERLHTNTRTHKYRMPNCGADRLSVWGNFFLVDVQFLFT